MTVNAAAGTLDCDEDDIAVLVLKGKLIAWNIARPGAGRREMRILTASVAWAASFGSLKDFYQAETRRWRWRNILALVFRGTPKHKIQRCSTRTLQRSTLAWVAGTELQRMLHCSSTHIIRLVRSRALKPIPGTRWQRGRGGSPAITRDSFLTFLEARLENAMSVRGLK